MTNPLHPLWQLVSLTRRTLDASPQLTRRQALRAAVNYLDRAECNLDGDLADRLTECAAAELAGNAAGITCGCDACEALTPETITRKASDPDAYGEVVALFVPCEPGGESPLDRAMRDA